MPIAHSTPSESLHSQLLKRLARRLFMPSVLALCIGCTNGSPASGTAEIHVSAATAKAVLPTGLAGELRQLGFEELPRRSPESQFRMFARRNPKGCLFGIPLNAAEDGDELALYFSAPAPVDEESKAVYRGVVEALQKKLGVNKVRAQARSSTGQTLL